MIAWCSFYYDVIQTHAQSQLTGVDLFWTDVLSGFTAHVSVLYLMRGKTPFISPQLVLDRDPRSTVGIHYLFCLSVLCRACLLILLLLLLVVILL